MIGNFLLNPQNGGSRGQNFQAWNGCSQVDIENNYALSSLDPKYTLPAKQEDSLNFGIASGVLVKNNYVTGGLSASGCGIIADDQADGVQFLGTCCSTPGSAVSRSRAAKTRPSASNRILDRDPVDGGGNTALYVWNQYASPCGPVSVTGNVVSGVKPDGTPSSFWNGGGCGTVTDTEHVRPGRRSDAQSTGPEASAAEDTARPHRVRRAVFHTRPRRVSRPRAAVTASWPRPAHTPACGLFDRSSRLRRPERTLRSSSGSAVGYRASVSEIPGRLRRCRPSIAQRREDETTSTRPEVCTCDGHVFAANARIGGQGRQGAVQSFPRRRSVRGGRGDWDCPRRGAAGIMCTRLSPSASPGACC